MADFKVIDFCKAQHEKEKKKQIEQEEEYAKAFAWAVAEQHRNGFLAQPVRLKAEVGDDYTETDEFIMSLYYNEEQKKAILRRDWKKDLAVRYDIVINFDEARKNAPEVIKMLLDNGVTLAKRWSKNQ